MKQQITTYLEKLENHYWPLKVNFIKDFFENHKDLAKKISEEQKEKIKNILKNFTENIVKDGLNYNKYVQEVEKEIEKITLKVVSLVSGFGTTMEFLAKKLKTGELGLIEVVGVIASNNGIEAIDKAVKQKIHTVILNKFHAKDPYTLNALAKLFDADVIIGNGWLPLIPKEVIEEFTKKGGIILNQHNGPLRANGLDFGGKGMIGVVPTAARIIYLLEAGLTGDDLFTESTVHIMTEEFDKGYSVGVEKLDIQKEIEEYRKKIKKLDKLENFNTLSEKLIDIKKQELLKEMIIDINNKLLVVEHKNVAETIAEIGKNKTVEKHPNYNEELVPEKNKEILERAKALAIQMFPSG